MQRKGPKAGRGIGRIIGGVGGGCAAGGVPGSGGYEETLLGANAVIDIDVAASCERQSRRCCGRRGGCACTSCCRRGGRLAG